ncbi:MAG TPA: hypothetical protein ENH84_03675 [Phycisphaerae bacterium]|nr:hypothetical protein [Phycisphaerae bacterium]
MDGNRPLVIGYHLVWTAYGWWLPNDPRGSTSKCIRSNVLEELGLLHYGRKRIQPGAGEIRHFYQQAEGLLKHQLLSFRREEIPCIASAFAEVVSRERYTCYACAILPDHVHMLIRKHKHKAEEMIANMQNSSRLRLRATDCRWAVHTVWGGPGWKVFLDHPDDIRRTVKYILSNPRKQHLPSQSWSFVSPYDGWPLHPGHNPNSPYARRLRSRER